MLADHTASKKSLRDGVRQQRLKQKELYKAMSVQIHTKKNYISKFLQTEISTKFSKNKMMEGDN